MAARGRLINLMHCRISSLRKARRPDRKGRTNAQRSSGEN